MNNTNIADLEVHQKNVNIEGKVIEVGTVREFVKFGKPGKVCNAVVEDDTAKVQLTLWNDQIGQIKVGDKIRIQNGYVNEWQGEKQITTGRAGTLEVLK